MQTFTVVQNYIYTWKCPNCGTWNETEENPLHDEYTICADCDIAAKCTNIKKENSNG